jgi:putative CocE/NonD family hydrolase
MFKERLKMSSSGVIMALFLAVAPSYLVAAVAEGLSPYDLKAHYTKSEFMITMRDGVRLHTTVYRPREATTPLPFLLFRTPYGTGPYGPDAYPKKLGRSIYSHSFEEEGFIFVLQDMRGRFLSEGGPEKPGSESDGGPGHASSDTYDTIEWLLANVPDNNGRVGLWGISASASLVLAGMINPHPAIRAASPQAPSVDNFIGDDFHHNGAFRLAYTFFWLSRNAHVRKGPSEQDSEEPLDFGTPDGYSFFLNMGPLSNANEVYLRDRVPEWNTLIKHGTYDEYWQRRELSHYLKNITFPVLNVAGWFDAEDFYGPITVYHQIEKYSPESNNFLYVGPFEHAGWNEHPDGNSLGNIRFKGSPAVYFREEIQLPFFRFYLKDKGEFNLSKVMAYETGANQMHTFDHWPPTDRTTERRLYLRAGGKLSFDRSPQDKGNDFDEYVSDPAKPVPSTAEIKLEPGQLWMVEDQRFSATRPDVLVYETDALKEDLVVAGPIVGHLVVSSSGTDSDFVLKIIDVYPGAATDNDPDPCKVRMGDYQMLLSGEVFRAKFRNSFVHPTPLVPNQPTAVETDLHDRYHRFLKGHRIMVHIQSTWFPVIDRNPQIFTDIYHAKASDFRKATQRVYRGAKLRSYLVLPVLNESK